ncbi:MAG TPA: hypothetical protein VK506_13095 [Conexibacter sp.]|nr:hypothetical protein [Conexibacter sp.]
MYATPRKGGTWELRESASTPAGPRSRTLATFRTLTPDVIAHAQARAAKPVDAEAIRRAAARAGAPVAGSAEDRAAGELISALAHGRSPRPSLRSLLADALGDARADAPSDSARAAAPWVAASAQERGDALRDLLLLADHLPAPRTTAKRAFPPIASRPA